MTALVMPHETGGEAWDVITLGGVAFTGLAAVEGDGFKKKLDRRHAAGSDGARIVDKGFDLVEVNITLTGWLAEHGEQMERLLAIVAPRTGNVARRAALDVQYPSLAAMGITQVYAVSSGLPKPDAGKLIWTIKFTEYREPPARNVTRAPRPQAQGADVAVDQNIQAAFDRNPLPTAPSASFASSPNASSTSSTSAPATFSR